MSNRRSLLLFTLRISWSISRLFSNGKSGKKCFTKSGRDIIRSWNTYGLRRRNHKLRDKRGNIFSRNESSPDVYTRNNLLVDERLLQLVRLLVALLDGELLDLRQLPRERLVLSTALPVVTKVTT